MKEYTVFQYPITSGSHQEHKVSSWILKAKLYFPHQHDHMGHCGADVCKERLSTCSPKYVTVRTIGVDRVEGVKKSMYEDTQCNLNRAALIVIDLG